MKTVVIGAGVVGLATAYELLKAGHDVVVIERDEYGQGPSFGNAAVVTGVLSFPVPAPGTIGVAVKSFLRKDQAISVHPVPSARFAAFLLRMANATRKSNFALGTAAQDLLTVDVFGDFDEYLDEGLTFEHHESGMLHVFESRAALDSAMKAFDDFPALRERVEVVNGRDELMAIDPGLAPQFTHGYLAPTDRQVEPMSLMRALVSAIETRGGQVLENTKVLDFIQLDGTVNAVVTTAGVYDADHVVIAAGVASRGLSAKLGFVPPLYSGGGYSIDVKFADKRLQPRTSVMTDKSHIAVTPLDWGLRASSGMIIGQPEPTVNEARIAKLKRDLAALYPEIPLDNVEPGWAGLRPMSADGVPLIGQIPGTTNAYLATGHAMLGLTYAPSTAKLIRKLIAGEGTPAHSLLSPNRFRILT